MNIGVDPYKIGLLGSMYFAGWTVSCAIAPRLADIYGRRIVLLISSGLAVPFYVGLILSLNLNLSIVLFFFFGLTQAGKSSNSYVYLMELIPLKYHTLVGTFMNFGDGSTLIIMSLYFRFISKSWLYYQVFAVTGSFFGFVAVLFMRESPKFYYSLKNFTQARESLKYMQKFNRRLSFNKCRANLDQE